MTNELDLQLETLLSEADKKKLFKDIDHELDSLYPSLKQLKIKKRQDKVIPQDEDIRTLESAMYPSMQRKP